MVASIDIGVLRGATDCLTRAQAMSVEECAWKPVLENELFDFKLPVSAPDAPKANHPCRLLLHGIHFVEFAQQHLDGAGCGRQFGEEGEETETWRRWW